MTNLKTYKVTYAPRVEVNQLAVNPLDDWDSRNTDGKYVLTQVYNHDNSKTKSIIVEAFNKETAKAIFALYVSYSIPLGKPMDFEVETLVLDAVSHITDISEVSHNE